MIQQVYKVLIADDEYWTREKLRQMIHWQDYALEFLEPAIDGEDALAKIESERPDILITDINMPFISGTELIKIVREKYPEIISFVISGYDDFEYVREALTGGAVNYLLKPVSKIDLVNALSKSLEIISQRQKHQSEQQDTRMRLLKASSLLLDREFSYFLREKEAAFTPNISLNTSLDIAGNSVMLVKIHDLREIKAAYNYDLNLYSYNTKQQIRSWFEGAEVMVFNNTSRTNEFLIFSNIEFSQIDQIAKKMLKGLQEYSGSVITIIINEHSFSVDNIRDVYKQTIRLLEFRPFSKESLILTTRDNRQGKGETEKAERFGAEQSGSLGRLIEGGHKSAIISWIEQYLNLDSEDGSLSFFEEKQATQSVIQYLYQRLCPVPDPQSMLKMEDQIEAADSYIDMIDKEALSELFRGIVDSMLEEKTEQTDISAQDAVEKAIAYVNEHYCEKITLTGIAQMVGVSSSYFSTMFSRLTGENLIAYITRLRIEKAAELIRSGSFNLTETAFMVGYEDYAYFSRIFRKAMGVSPRDYASNQETEDKGQGTRKKNPTD
ncbi:MAG TPA: response regulator [Flexilinea sp.]|jgi:AraC-like DNA-binding protein/DNA-binding NarL/FixJ family response regulator|nr:response regulator [Flexilinea sp.]HPR70554.1 response regulator [Flexilinea sp.]